MTSEELARKTIEIIDAFGDRYSEAIDAIESLMRREIGFDAQRGDIITYHLKTPFPDTKWIFIFKDVRHDGFDSIDYYALYDGEKVHTNDVCSICYDIMRPATHEEKDELFKALDENGFIWDEKQRKILRKEWK